jgi:hypothetical protein
MSEALNGHPDHAWLAVGNMSEAEDEIVTLYPAVAEAIRGHRKKYEDSLDEGEIYHVPILEMIGAITRFIREEQKRDLQGASQASSPTEVRPTSADGDSVPGLPVSSQNPPV